MSERLLDGFGVYGTFLHYGLVMGLVATAWLLFFYLWKKGGLDMDEEAKYWIEKQKEEGEGQ